MARLLRFAIYSAFFFSAGMAFAAGGPCPANSPIAGNSTCYFVAANGSDTNSGTSESSPWLHSPGMPNCTGTCLTVQTSWGSYGNTPKNISGAGIVFRGGDTWHEGNSALSPYTGGTINFFWSGGTSCNYENYSSCFYIGVDTSWYNASVCGTSWCRPKFNGDNPLSTSLVSSCAYQTGSQNQLIVLSTNLNTYLYVDSLEVLGLCTSDTTHAGQAQYDAMVYDAGTLMDGLPGMLIQNNIYAHGWTASTSTASNTALACNVLGGGGLESKIGVVVDGSDSNPGVCAWGIFQSNYHLVNSIIRYATQGVGSNCHDTHDNVFEYMAVPYIPTHGNTYECNQDATGSAPGQPANTPNVVYNNVFRHDLASSGNPDLWLCPTAVPEYWFNNLMYDLGGEGWSIAGPAGYSGCPSTGRQYMFNNTLVDMTQPCYLNAANNGTGGQYLSVFNEHLIGSVYDQTLTPGCSGGPASASNVSMSDATATSQGYTTGSAGNVKANSCANETTTPCNTMVSSNATVGKGVNQQSYCTSLASYTSETAISVDAANACKYGATDGCGYNTTTHTMVCPAWKGATRPPSTAWDSGAYQYSGAPSPTNVKPTNQ
jgi:hypothetical protein